VINSQRSAIDPGIDRVDRWLLESSRVNGVKSRLIFLHDIGRLGLTGLASINQLILHSYVPNTFGHTIIVPLVKDRNGDVSKLSNYRDISLSPIISKLFEACLSNKFACYLVSHDLQFGFQKNSSCASAIFVVQQTVDYFTQRGSCVFLSALDASKAFDRVDHRTLFQN